VGIGGKGAYAVGKEDQTENKTVSAMAEQREKAAWTSNRMGVARSDAESGKPEQGEVRVHRQKTSAREKEGTSRGHVKRD